MNTVIYTRVSTSVQDYQRQIDELQQFASSRGWNVLQVFSEKVSGAKKNEERQELQSLMSYISTHNVEKVLVWELSRLGRNTLEVLKTIEEFNTLGISLFIKNYNIETLNEDGKPNVMSQFLVRFQFGRCSINIQSKFSLTNRSKVNDKIFIKQRI